MKAERQQKDITYRTIQPKQVSRRLSFVDNRPQAAIQTKMIDVIQRYELSSRVLAGNLEAVSFKPYTHEAHHIIPSEIVNKCFPQKVRQDNSIYADYDLCWNGIYLPGKPNNTDDPESNGCKLPYHRRSGCSHTTYTKWVRERLGDMDLTSDNSNIHDTASSIRNIIKNMPDRTCLDDISASANRDNESTSTLDDENCKETRHNPKRNQKKDYKDPSDSDEIAGESDSQTDLREIVKMSLILDAQRDDYIEYFFARADDIKKANPEYSLIDALSSYMDPETKTNFTRNLDSYC